ncbi:2-C-methyl-D-erythritol 4-phosphate cytidylyltransferase [Alienimonas californiensis]|uniref:2-C-methyl-D-erythritol 4-phosphate cytidylyltransferase n=1 Tax=Alienimonas californiensis TaxID=2527989 RepID=A0A517PBZ0_9PLAN|nr:2-C-methyl-D-erythritol 4-phosphate cytidylyltransferase [Alienimonas californiensis]QDT16871.1 2-C-methyl-D-erythritol 4-phosphate cytidylyltransferase [Alienimonas californiensis]
MTDPTVAVVLPAAGRGSRLGGSVRKAYAELDGVPLWRRSLELFTALPQVVRVVLAVAREDVERFAAENREVFAELNRDGERVLVVAGGAERVDSVAHGIERCGDAELIAVHDAARPLAPREDLAAVFAAAAEQGAALLCTPIASTVKRVRDGRVVETVPRTELWAAQTPQVARAALMRRAFAGRHAGPPATDEAELLERAGIPVAVVRGSARNFKITTPADFALAEALVRAEAASPAEAGAAAEPVHRSPLARGSAARA